MTQTQTQPSSLSQWQSWKDKELPEPEQIAANVWSIPILIPNHPMRYTLSYALIGENGKVILVDTSWPGDGAWDSLTAQVQKTGLDLGDIEGIVITHQHPDHHGLSSRLKELTGAWIGMHPLDIADLEATLTDHRININAPSESRQKYFAEAGIDQAFIDAFANTSPDTHALFSGLVKADVALNDGDKIELAGRNIEVVWTPGHTPGSICLIDHDNNIIFTGDHVLPRISPNVGMHFSKDRKPLSDYIQSLKKVTKYDGAHVAPAHEYRFDTLADRVAEILDHHEVRLDEISELLQEQPEISLWQIAQRLTWSRGWEGIDDLMKFAALSETDAHLEVLGERGQLSIARSDNGTKLYSYSD